MLPQGASSTGERQRRPAYLDVHPQVDRSIGPVVLEKGDVAFVLVIDELRPQRPALCEGPGHSGGSVVKCVHPSGVEERVDVTVPAALSPAKEKCTNPVGKSGLKRDSRAVKRL